MSDQISPGEDVYEAAARAYANELTKRQPLSGLIADHPPFRAAVDSAYAVGVAAGRAQAAADIRDESLTWCMDGTGRHLVKNCAEIAGGEPYG